MHSEGRSRPNWMARLVALAALLTPSAVRAQSPLVTEAKTEFAAYTDTDAVTVFTPSASARVTDPIRGWSANGRYLADIVSAASVDIVSTASRKWTEVRHAAGIGASYKPGRIGGTVDASFSSEPDYVALAAGGRLVFELDEATVNPTFGYYYGHDTAGKTGTPFSVYSQPLARHSLDAGAEFVLGRATAAYLGVGAILERGDQKKPYRYLPVFDPALAPSISAGASLAEVNNARNGKLDERTPQSRNRFNFAARLSHRFERSTLVLSERLYADDWGLFASTVDARYVQDLGVRFSAWLHFRAHLQSGVSFWRVAYAGVPTAAIFPEYRTGDRELSPLAAGTFGAGGRWNFGSRTRPSAWGLVLQTDVTATDFFDALYLRSRLAQIGIVQVEAEL